MNRKKAIAWLRSVGRNASARDWALGETILITVGDAKTANGIAVYLGVVYLYPDDDKWHLLDCDRPDPAESYEDLASAMLGVHDYVARKEGNS